MYLMVSKYLAVHTWWIIYLKDSKHCSHQNLQIKVCCSKHVKQLALNLLHIVKILSFIEAMELSRQATAVYKTIFLLEEHKAQWHCLYNLLRFLNYRIKVPRSYRGPWHHCMSVQSALPVPLPNAQQMQYTAEFRRYTPWPAESKHLDTALRLMVGFLEMLCARPGAGLQWSFGVPSSSAVCDSMSLFNIMPEQFHSWGNLSPAALITDKSSYPQ